MHSGCDWSTTSVVHDGYDAFNDLLARTGYTRGAPPIVDIHYFSQFFVYDGANQVLALGADGSVTDRYLWGPGVNQLLADDNYALGLSSPTLWTLGDNQNSIRDLVSSDGTLQQHIAYSPFGQQIVTAAGAFSTEAVCVFGYTGSYTDVVTGDVLNGVRWYDPSSERWLTQDPAAADENLYRYCGNAPTDGTDPTGLLTVYVWGNTSEAWGHALILLDDGTTYISWWPVNNGDSSTDNAVPNRTFALDVKDESRQPTNTITIKGLDETAIKKWWDKFSSDPSNKWKSLSQNCSTVVADALMEGGSAKCSSIHHWIWSPADVENYANDVVELLPLSPEQRAFRKWERGDYPFVCFEAGTLVSVPWGTCTLKN